MGGADDSLEATMTSTRTRRARRTGYAVTAVVDAVLLVLIAVAPGWRVVPFLTERAAEVVSLVVVGIAVDLMRLTWPLPLVVRLADVVTTTVALAVLWRTWALFPFDFGDSEFPWATIGKVVLPFLGVAVLIAFLAQVVALLRVLVDPAER